MTDNPKPKLAKRVRAAKPRAKRYDVWGNVVTELALRVGANGHRSFFLRGRCAGASARPPSATPTR